MENQTQENDIPAARTGADKPAKESEVPTPYADPSLQAGKELRNQSSSQVESLIPATTDARGATFAATSAKETVVGQRNSDSTATDPAGYLVRPPLAGSRVRGIPRLSDAPQGPNQRYATSQENVVPLKPAINPSNESLQPNGKDSKENQSPREFIKRNGTSNTGDAKDFLATRREQLHADGISDAINKGDGKGLKRFVELLNEDPESIQRTLEAVREKMFETNPSIHVRWETGKDNKGEPFARLKLDHVISKSGPFTHVVIDSDGNGSATQATLIGGWKTVSIPMSVERALAVMNGEARGPAIPSPAGKMERPTIVPLSQQRVLDSVKE